MRKFFGRQNRHSKFNFAGRRKQRSSRSGAVRTTKLGVEWLENRRMLAAGDLDTTFGGGDGLVVQDLGIGKHENIFASAVQADGKVVVVGSAINAVGVGGRDFLIARFNENGSLDTSFGTSGYTILDMSDPGTGGSNIDDQANDLVIQSDGSIIVAGTASKITTGTTRFNAFALAKLTSTGQLDTSFDGDGKQFTHIDHNSLSQKAAASATAVAVDSQGRIVVGGTVNMTFTTRNDFVVARYNANGSIDTSFVGVNHVDPLVSTVGYSATDFDETSSSNDEDNLWDIAIQSDDRIVAVGDVDTNDLDGSLSQDFGLARFNTNGSLDTSFGGDGKVMTDVLPSFNTSNDTAKAVAIEADGQIVVAGDSVTRFSTFGSFNTEFSMARYNSDGTLDTSFSPSSEVDGTLTISFGTNDDVAEGLILQPQPDGKYVIGGRMGTTAATMDFALARVLPNGSLDTSFSGDGKVNVHFPEATSFTSVADLVLQPSGKIVAVGWIRGAGLLEDIAMARFESGLVLNSIGGLATAAEGATYTLNLTSTDPTTTQWTINWGDGSPPEVILGNPSTATHVYGDGPNNYTISATLNNSSGTVVVGSHAVSVENVDPSLTVSQAAVVVNEGQTATNSGTFGDVPADVVSIVSSIGSVAYAAGVWNWTYNATDDLQQVVTITATDEDGGETVTTFNLTVNNVAPNITVDDATVSVDGGQTATNSGTYSDVGADTVTIVASVGTITQSAGVWTWSLNTATEDPLQEVTIAAIDDDTGRTVVTFTLAVSPALTVVPDQTIDEGGTVNLPDIGEFTDVIQGGEPGPTIGLDANDFTSLGAFDPTSDVTIDTSGVAPTLTFGSTTIIGTTVLAQNGVGNPTFEIAVFTFSSFELDAGITLTATGSRPLALLSQGDMRISGTIDVSAEDFVIGTPGDPGAGGGRGGDFVLPRDGDDAAGAPSSGGGTLGPGGPLGGGSGSGGGSGGIGGHGEVFGNPTGNGTAGSAPGGADYVDLTQAIQGGSGGSASGRGKNSTNSTPVVGGSGGGGIELGAANKITITSTGQVLADGGNGDTGTSVVISGTGGGGGGAGNILLHGTSIEHAGLLSAKGGNGGGGIHTGGGGGGGDIMLVRSNTGTILDNGTEIVTGGLGGGAAAANGGNGDVHVVVDTITATPVTETYDYSIDWGDGSTVDTGAATVDTPGINVGDLVQGSFDGMHTYADNGAYTVTVTINDSSGGSDTKTFTVTVNNLDPALTVDQAAVAVDEGETATNSGTYGDVAADVVSVSASVGTIVDNGNGTWSWSFDSTDGPVESQIVTITAVDEDGGVTNVTFNLTVDNLDPTLTVDQGSITADEGQSVINSGTFGDVPADTVTVVASIGTVTQGIGVWSWSYDTVDDFAGLVTITATDEDGGLTQVTFNLTVSNVDPTLTVDDASVTIDEGQTATNGGTYADVAADTVTLVASIGTVLYSGGLWTWSYNGTDDLATQTVTIAASDEDGGSAIATFDLTVDNAAPSLTIANGSVTIDEGQTATNGGTYADVPADTVTLTASIGTVTYSSGTWSWSYVGADDLAAQTVTITASDEDGGSAIATFDLTVNNADPTLTVAQAVVTIDEGQIASNGGTYSDVPADIVTVTASIGTVSYGGGTWSWSYNGPDDVATQIVTITASDDDGGSITATFDLTVNNVAPTLTVDQSSVSVNEGQLATNSGTYGDVPADTVTVTASMGTVVFSGGTWTWSYTGADGASAQTVTITASDEDGGSTIATFDLTVNNVAPTVAVDSASVTVTETQTATNSGTYADVPADTVTLTASVGTIVNNNDGTWSWSLATNDNLPTQTVAITASDEDGGSTVATFNFTVNNVAPTANAGGPYFTFDDTPITLTGSGSDVAGAADPLTYDWDLDNNGTFETAGQNAVFDPQALGFTGTQTRTVSLRVSDGDGGVTVATTTVELLGVGTALIGGVLHVVGSDSMDVVLVTQLGSNIHVIASFNSSNPVSFAASSVTEIQVRTRGNIDIVLTTPNVSKQMTIDGGSGNDLLTGGGGRNVIMGGLGHDVIHGSAGDDVILGGDGNDDLFGGSGNDVLVGGNGNDILEGGSGRDVIIGSQDEDTLKGGNDDDVLIGGFTSHDSNVAALDAVMAIWGSSASFSSRVATLTGSGGLLQAGVTVFDDDDDDTIMGNAGRDLVFGDTNPWDGAVDSINLNSLQDVLVAVN
jgi:uncharacterized delta-60 repeat protein